MFSSNGISRLMDKVISQHMVAGCSSSGKLANLVLANATSQSKFDHSTSISACCWLPYRKLVNHSTKLKFQTNLTNIWSEHIINKVFFSFLFSRINISYDSSVKTREQGIDRCKSAWVSISLNGHYIYASTSFKYFFTHEPMMRYGNKVENQGACND